MKIIDTFLLKKINFTIGYNSGDTSKKYNRCRLVICAPSARIVTMYPSILVDGYITDAIWINLTTFLLDYTRSLLPERLLICCENNVQHIQPLFRWELILNYAKLFNASLK